MNQQHMLSLLNCKNWLKADISNTNLSNVCMTAGTMESHAFENEVLLEEGV